MRIVRICRKSPKASCAAIHPARPQLGSLAGWRTERGAPALSEVHGSIAVRAGAPAWRRALVFLGPGYLVAVGYMDPGNWATSLAGGSRFGYTLLFAALVSSVMAIILQALCARLAVATGRDLAQACRDSYSPPVSFGLWVLAELAIVATDLAEVIGTAIGLNLLFGIPLEYGVIITALDVFLVLYLQNKGFRWIEAFIITLLLIIAVCFVAQLVLAQPELSGILGGFVPRPEIVTNPEMLYLALGILGATVMPHNLYLHTAIVQTRAYGESDAGEARGDPLRHARFHHRAPLRADDQRLDPDPRRRELPRARRDGRGGSRPGAFAADAAARRGGGAGPLRDRASRLRPLLHGDRDDGRPGGDGGLPAACASRHGSAASSPAASPSCRRRASPSIAGDAGAAKLLIFSRWCLSLQLSFAVVPLVMFTASRAKMGVFVSPRWLTAVAVLIAAVIVILNVKLVVDFALAAALVVATAGVPTPLAQKNPRRLAQSRRFRA